MISRVYNALRSDVRTTGISGETELDLRCVNCYRKERVLCFTNLRKADHIFFGGQRFVFDIGDRRVTAYTHHAIVKSVRVLSQSSAIVTLIHFYSTPYDTSIRIQETNELLDLHYHDIHVICYRHDKHSPDTIIARAEELIEQNGKVHYSIFSCNCEHFCNWCCVGNEKSLQVDNAIDVIRAFLDGAANCGRGRIANVVRKLLKQIFDYLMKNHSVCLTFSARGVMTVMAIFYLVYTLYRHYKLNKDLTSGTLCSACCLRRKHDLWIQFVAYFGLQVGGLGLLSLITSAGASKGIVAGVLVAYNAITLACNAAVPRLRNIFCPPFQGRLLRVRSLKDIKIGDIISFDHWNLSHDGVVCAVKVNPGTREKEGEVTVIHYSLPRLFGRRTIVEGTITVNLGNDLILLHDYIGYKVHDPDIVVQRAKQRVGETKFGIITNRSCHFCHWAKVNKDLIDQTVPESVLRFLHEIDPYETISNLPSRSFNVIQTRGRKQVDKLTNASWARIRDDIKPGQIIEFKYGCFWHSAVSINVSFDNDASSVVSVTVVHFGKQKVVCEETFIFNLNSQDVWIYVYHPLYKYRTDDVIRRARARIGENNYSLLRHRSDHLASEIVFKEMTSVVRGLNELKPGDVITYYYWSLKHDAVVTRVSFHNSKMTTIGEFNVIHYALDKLFEERTVKEETIRVNLTKQLVCLKHYDGYVTYPPENVVSRARSRLGEQRFSIRDNTSSDLAHWAKVVQFPAIVSISPAEDRRSLASKDNTYLLVPKVGKQCEKFQRFRVNAWSELYPGVIIEYKYYWIWHQGILSFVDMDKKMIKVIHYGASHLFATRTVLEDIVKLDLRYENVWMYQGHPNECYEAGRVLENARRRLGEKQWCNGKRSWDFCKDCVLRNRV